MPKAGFTFGPRIAAPDYKQIDEDAEQQVLKDLGVEDLELTDVPAMARSGKIRPDDLLVKAAQIVEQADAELGVYLEERDQALAHLWFYEQRIGLAKTAGLTLTAYRNILSTMMFGQKQAVGDHETAEEIVQAAEAAGVQRIDDAEARLLKAAAIVRAARTRRGLALRYQQEAALALTMKPYDWSTGQIAETAGVEWQTAYSQVAVARKRHGL
ncbi:hypothetical protein [Streptomyces zaomyceticus]|uniref:hypothetical protein n=1 Tax=Streptomyces zaomyceticus TaxID=68286 RepID=UPI002E24946C